MNKLIITAAVVGGELTRNETPYLPLTPAEIATEVHAAWQAGASIAHIHARDVAGNPTQDAAVYAEIIREIQERCDIVIQVSSGGSTWMSAEERIAPVTLSPEMATLTTGTVNFGRDVFLNSPEMLDAFAEQMMAHGVAPEFEIFEVGMIENALSLVRKGKISGHLHFDFVLGVPGGIPATAKNLLHLIDLLPAGATWTVAGIGRHELTMAALAIPLGGHVRVGFEDNIYYRKGQLATSNSELVARVARLAQEQDREVASPTDVRQLLQLPRKRN